jgi:hypothetical protein
MEYAAASGLAHTPLNEVRPQSIVSEALAEAVRDNHEGSRYIPDHANGADNAYEPATPDERVASGMIWPPSMGEWFYTSSRRLAFTWHVRPKAIGLASSTTAGKSIHPPTPYSASSRKAARCSYTQPALTPRIPEENHLTATSSSPATAAENIASGRLSRLLDPASPCRPRKIIFPNTLCAFHMRCALFGLPRGRYSRRDGSCRVPRCCFRYPKPKWIAGLSPRRTDSDPADPHAASRRCIAPQFGAGWAVCTDIDWSTNWSTRC